MNWETEINKDGTVPELEDGGHSGLGVRVTCIRKESGKFTKINLDPNKMEFCMRSDREKDIIQGSQRNIVLVHRILFSSLNRVSRPPIFRF